MSSNADATDEGKRVRWSRRQVEHIEDGRVTSVLLHTGTFPWAVDLKPGDQFQVLTPESRGWAVELDVRVTRVCAHQPIRDIAACAEGHDPTAVRPGRTGWAKTFDDATELGEDARLHVSAIREKQAEQWIVVDFAPVAGRHQR